MTVDRVVCSMAEGLDEIVSGLIVDGDIGGVVDDISGVVDDVIRSNWVWDETGVVGESVVITGSLESDSSYSEGVETTLESNGDSGGEQEGEDSKSGRASEVVRESL
eukprot:TRINITY_DN3845_c0_g1_i16.p3 TRINITY_DN3845_c0_g1~~TRINITY_DN3845_c0_g1_i16.p3  ORF type:complete len:107 (-),score=31.25 TRINITY_DN3845_c0_g1_i16:1142-1462(-)